MKARNCNETGIKKVKPEVSSELEKHSTLLIGTTGRGRSRAFVQQIQAKLNSNQSYLMVDPHDEGFQEFMLQLEQDV